MAAPNESILALVAEAANDALPRDYVSEGLYAAAGALNCDQNNKRIVLSSNILGPTWFSDTALRFNSKMTTGAGPATKEIYRRAVASGQILSLDEMMSRIIDPSWRLTEAGAEEMTEFGFLKQALLLNVLNGFEYIMSNVFKSASELVSAFSSFNHNKIENEKSPSWLVDSGILLRNSGSSGNTSTADVAVGRARRVVGLFCYTLIDILKWKKAISERTAARGLIPFESMPPDAPYERLITLIEDRGKNFIEGLLDEDNEKNNAGNGSGGATTITNNTTTTTTTTTFSQQ